MLEGNRLRCPISGSLRFEELFKFKKFPIYMGVVDKGFKTQSKDLVFNINKYTGTVQIYPRVSLKKLYFKSHGSGTIGKVWKNHHIKFYEYLSKFFKGQIVEIGGGHNSISQLFEKLKLKKKTKLISFDPNGKKLKNKNHKMINKFFDKKDSIKLKNKVDLVIHSHLFEHIYDPNFFLNNINQILTNEGYHIFSVPNLRKMIESGFSNAMNFEHPYFLEEKLIDKLLNINNFKIIDKRKYLNHSIFYCTKKENLNNKSKYKEYTSNKKLFLNYYKKIKRDIKKINLLINNKNNVYLFGAHIFSQTLIFNGLNCINVRGILDNDKNKQNKYLYGTKLRVFKPDILKKVNNPVVILKTGVYNSEIKKQIKQINKTTIFI